MFFLISNDRILFRGEAASLDDFKRSHPIPAGLSGTLGGMTAGSIPTSITNEYIEIPTDILGGLTGYTSVDGSTSGMSAAFTAVDISGITYSESFIRGDVSERFEVLGIGTDNPLSSNDQLFSFSNSGVEAAAGSFELLEKRTSNTVELDPRLSPNMTLANLQIVKGRESENDFLEEGLGATQAISFEMDDGSAKTLTFDNRRETILDLLMIKHYSDLNQTIVNSSTQTSVSVTGIQLLDYTGTVTKLSPVEYDKFIHSLLSSFYENYLSHINTKSVIENPVGATDAEKKTYILSKTNVSFATSLVSTFATVSSGK